MVKTIKTNMRIAPITNTLSPFGPGKSGFLFGAMKDALSAKAMNTAATTMSATLWPVVRSAASRSTPAVYALASSRFSSLRCRPRVSHQRRATSTAIGKATMRM